MTVISNSVEIRCTPEEAFDYLADHRSELEWNPGIEPAGELTDGPVGQGTRYQAKWKSAPEAVEVETIAYDRPHVWSVHNGGPVEVTGTIGLQPATAGTRLSSDFEVRPHGFFRLIFPLFLMKIRKGEAANMTHLKAAPERRAAEDVLVLGDCLGGAAVQAAGEPVLGGLPDGVVRVAGLGGDAFVELGAQVAEFVDDGGLGGAADLPPVAFAVAGVAGGDLAAPPARAVDTAIGCRSAG